MRESSHVSLFDQADPAVYLVSARAGNERGGMIASWVTQATLSAEHPRVLAVISVANHTQRLIEASGRFALQLLAEDQTDVVARFGLPAPPGAGKWDGFEAGRTRSGLPLVAGACGFAECAVRERLPTGDRVLYLADVVEERVEAGRRPLRESAALARQPETAAAALAESYARDVRRDDALLSAKDAPATEPEALMRLAIEKTREGLARGQGPVGCAIARDGVLLAAEHNRVFETGDRTAHAEMVALRAASRRAGSDTLQGAVVASTCEPCPMCAAALHLARVDVVYYGATIADLDAMGFPQIPLSAASLLTTARSRTRVVPGILAEECRALLALFDPARKPPDPGR